MRERCLSSALMAVLLISSTVSAQTPEMIAKVDGVLTQKRLQGAWVPDLLMTTKGAEAYPLSGRALVFDGTVFARVEGKRTVASGSWKIEEGFLRLTVEERNRWDLEAAETPAKLQYAFKVEGDVLTLCYSAGDKGKPDDLSPGKGRQVVVYKRQKDKGKEAK